MLQTLPTLFTHSQDAEALLGHFRQLLSSLEPGAANVDARDSLMSSNNTDSSSNPVASTTMRTQPSRRRSHSQVAPAGSVMFGTYRRLHKNGTIVWVDLEAQAIRARVPPGVADPTPFQKNCIIVVERVRRQATKSPLPSGAVFGLASEVQVRDSHV
jgi:hypothetical protein